MKSYRDWCAARNCSHAHCPNDCDHPQPFVDYEGILLCGRCWILNGLRTLMLPCNKETCPDV